MTSHSDNTSVWPRWMTLLEQAHVQVTLAAGALGTKTKPTSDLTPAALAVETAFGAIYDVVDQRTSPLTATRRAIDAVLDAKTLLTPEAGRLALAAAIDALEQAHARLSEVDAYFASKPETPATPPASVLLASGDLPRLHEIDRPSLKPTIVVDAPVAPPPVAIEVPPRPKTFEELHAAVAELDKLNAERARTREAAKAEKSATPEDAAKSPETKSVPDGFAPDAPPALSALEFIHSRTRECFEEVTMVGMQRAPLLGDPWRVALHLEQRMFRAIDSIASMGAPAIVRLEPLAFDAPIKEASRVFALAMTLGCMRGRDALAAAERVYADFVLSDPLSNDSFAAALKLVPHDMLPLALRTLLSSALPERRAIAIDVLGYRGLATTSELVTAAFDDPTVALKALPYAALARADETQNAIDNALAIEHDDPRALWLAMALHGHRELRANLTAALDGDHGGRAALLLALAGDEGDASALLQRMNASPTTGLATAVGWAGDAAAFGPLVELLDHDDEAVAVAAAYALEKLTGAELIVETEIEAEEIAVPEPPDPDVGEPRARPLVRIVSDRRDLPPQPSTETIEQPTTKQDAWRAWWQEHGDDLKSGRRYRRGKPYSTEVVFAELDNGMCTPAERSALQAELVIRSGKVVRLDPHDFVVVQEEALREWAPLARSGSSHRGSWHRPAPR